MYNILSFFTLFLSTLSLFFLSYYLFRCIYLSFSISLLYIVRHLNKTISHKFCCTCISYRPPPLSLFALVISNTVTIATYIYRIDCHTYVPTQVTNASVVVVVKRITKTISQSDEHEKCTHRRTHFLNALSTYSDSFLIDCHLFVGATNQQMISMTAELKEHTVTTRPQAHPAKDTFLWPLTWRW